MTPVLNYCMRTIVLLLLLLLLMMVMMMLITVMTAALLVHNVLLEVIEVRTCVLIGSVVMAGGIMVATFANTVPLLILTMGGCVGQ